MSPAAAQDSRPNAGPTPAAWLRIFDSFVPEAVRQAGEDAQQRARLAVATAVVGFVIFLCVGITQHQLGPALRLLSLLVALAMAGVPVLLRLTRALGPALNVVPFLAFFYSVSLTAASGGEFSGALYSFAVVPVIAMLLAGVGPGLVWAALTAGALLAIGLAVRAGFEFPVQPDPGSVASARFGGAILLTAALTSVALFYETTKGRALRAAVRALASAERERAAVLESEERLSTLLANASDVVSEWDSQGRLRYVSAEVEEVLGAPPDSFAGAHLEDFASWTDAENFGVFRDAFWQALRERRQTEASFCIRARDGQQRWFELALRAFETRDGELHVVSVGRDVTERREVETLRQLTRELEETAAELSRANRELEEFTAVASHDLQEPIRQIASFASLLQSDLPPEIPEDAKRDLHFIEQGARRMQRLVHDLLELSKAGSAPMKRERVSVDACVDQALEDLALAVRETGARIRREPLPEVMADRTLLTVVYQNLISNALKFHRADAPRVTLTVEASAEGPVLGVRDEGIGIPPDQLERIFEPFRRAHGEARYPGSGIGLTFCRKAVERHGGCIWVESTPGRGSHFRFRLG